jgi:hypothetical protein
LIVALFFFRKRLGGSDLDLNHYCYSSGGVVCAELAWREDEGPGGKRRAKANEKRKVGREDQKEGRKEPTQGKMEEWEQDEREVV